MIRICSCILALIFSVNAYSLQARVEGLNTPSLLEKTFISKTEIVIKNGSPQIVWVFAPGLTKLVLGGTSLRIYSDEVELQEVHIKMAKSLGSEPFFDRFVPNHSTLHVTDYLPST